MTTFVRVRDRDTGHEYDVAEQAVDKAVHEVLKGYPTSDRARPAKHRTDKAGRPARHVPAPSGAGEAGRPATTEKE